ncbi:hypothetical protein Vi05172_g12592 [Venturia inaequalis]|nr:hypothetical protein Vi05172_g12592 [Venturia inaequalis]
MQFSANCKANWKMTNGNLFSLRIFMPFLPLVRQKEGRQLTIISDQMYMAPVIRNAESMVLHTGAPAYVTQDNNLNRDIFAILLRDTFLSLLFVRIIACWQSQEKYGQSSGAKDGSTKEIIPKTVQQFRWHLEGKCALLKGYVQFWTTDVQPQPRPSAPQQRNMIQGWLNPNRAGGESRSVDYRRLWTGTGTRIFLEPKRRDIG